MNEAARRRLDRGEHHVEGQLGQGHVEGRDPQHRHAPVEQVQGAGARCGSTLPSAPRPAPPQAYPRRPDHADLGTAGMRGQLEPRRVGGEPAGRGGGREKGLEADRRGHQHRFRAGPQVHVPGLDLDPLEPVLAPFDVPREHAELAVLAHGPGQVRTLDGQVLQGQGQVVAGEGERPLPAGQPVPGGIDDRGERVAGQQPGRGQAERGGRGGGQGQNLAQVPSPLVERPPVSHGALGNTGSRARAVPRGVPGGSAPRGGWACASGRCR